MVKIRKVIKNPIAALSIFPFFLILILFIVLCFFIGSSKTFSPSSSHIVVNKWSNENSRKKNICTLEFTENEIFSTTLERIPRSETMLVIKSKNLRFMLYAKGKIFFSNLDEKYSGYGKNIQIIDISDLKENEELNLLISPIENKKGAVLPDILLTSKNEYLFDLIYENSGLIILILFLLFCAIFELLKGLNKLISKDKKAPKSLYLSGFIIIISLIPVLENDISFFITDSGSKRNIFLLLCFSLLGINITSYLYYFIKKALPDLIGRAKTILY